MGREIWHTSGMSKPAVKVFSDRIQRIEVSATMAITAEALRLKKQGIDLADFGAGEPHFATPDHIKRAAIEAIEQNFTRYTNVAGIPEVRQAIVERHAADFGTEFTPDECVFSTGGKLALFNAMEVLVDHGDEVILPAPYWVSYKDIIQYAGGKPVILETSEADNFRVTAAAIERALTPKTKAILAEKRALGEEYAHTASKEASLRLQVENAKLRQEKAALEKEKRQWQEEEKVARRAKKRALEEELQRMQARTEELHSLLELEQDVAKVKKEQV